MRWVPAKQGRFLLRRQGASSQAFGRRGFIKLPRVTSSCPDLQIVFPAGIHLQVHGHYDRQLLREAVALLREASC